MKIAILILIILHGLIHLIGFFKAFEIGEVKLLTQQISKPMGLMWLAATLLFLTSAFLFLSKSNNWLYLAIAAIIVSQMLIFTSWEDAKFGTIANLIILLIIIVKFYTIQFYNRFQNDVKSSFSESECLKDSVLLEEDILRLPEIVKKYIRISGCIGKPKVCNFKVDFEGKLRKNNQSEWMPFTSTQFNFIKSPTRLFYLNAKMKNLPVAGYHCFKKGKASMDIRLFSMVKVQFQDGQEMNQAETVTFFNDMCCLAPATLIDQRIKWIKEENNNVLASFVYNNIKISAWLYFNDRGELINFISDDRFSTDAGKKLPWSTPLKDYQKIGGYLLFKNAQTIYRYPDRDECYGTFVLKKIEFNL